MQKAEYSPWSGNNFPCNKQNMLAVNVSEKEADLPEGDLKPNVDGYVECGKRPSLVAKVLNVITRLWDFAGQSDSTFASQTPDTIEKEDPCERKTISVTATMPIFETKKDGTGRLTVPLDYDSTADDVAMTPAGVYVEDVPTCGRTTTRPVGLRKRRKQSAKGNQQTAAAGESVKVGGKNRKDKKRSHLRNDIYDDSLALSMDEWYDYRNDEYGDPIGSGCYLSTSFSPSSIESVNSFHDALQDLGALVLGACMQGSFGSAGGPSSSSVDVTPSPHLSARRSSTTQPAPSVDERVQPKCDISSDRSDFVVVTDREVFTTPSASPARRRPPRGLCTAFTYYFNKPPSTDPMSHMLGHYMLSQCPLGQTKVVTWTNHILFVDYRSYNVRFCQKPVIHVMRAWDFAYRQARKGEWEMAARDRERFRKRIDDLEPVLGPALQPSVRDKIYAERFSRPEESPPARAMETTDFPT
ncbi:AGAP004848-PA-like protein [Anopheles sinensis]|uniref:AGAP004848-PA-like protein n=1 Tax=Anopheles sinensis TaxID=74873 RepID=A0A084VUD6_ANOSI|nr:AGAP004848-PA-like protein [Anopheles sinensis]